MPRYTVGKTFRFEAAHSLPHLPEGHKCKNLHGHSYSFCVEVDGPLDDRGFVVDYDEISVAVQPIVESLDHKNLNEVLMVRTTAENIAAWIFLEVKRNLGRCSRVRLWETPTSVVVYEE